jgi:hypothetical protein
LALVKISRTGRRQRVTTGLSTHPFWPMAAAVEVFDGMAIGESGFWRSQGQWVVGARLIIDRLFDRVTLVANEV